jgi:hypothetical protein
MEKEEIVVEEPVTNAEYTIEVITRKSLYYQKNKEGAFFIGTKHPLAILLTKGSKKVLRMIEDDAPVEKLIEKYTELKNLL